jgi:hypothetical protein
MRPPLYLAYGLGIQSDFSLAPCTLVKNKSSEIRVSLAKEKISVKNLSAFHTLRFKNNSIYARFYRVGKYFLVHFPRQATCLISKSGRRIECDFSSAMTASEKSILVLHHVLPLALSLQGKLVLHAAAVVVARRAQLICGPAGLGKSTIAAFLQSKKYPILTDDACLIHPQGSFFTVRPSLPLIRTWDKKTSQKLALVSKVKANAPAVRVQNIYFPSLSATSVRKLTALEASPNLFAQSFRLSMQPQDLRREFRQILNLCEKVSFYEVPYRHHRTALRNLEAQLLRGSK